MITTVLFFALKTFLTGVMLAWGFANGYRVDATVQQIRDFLKAIIATWPGLTASVYSVLALVQPPQIQMEAL